MTTPLVATITTVLGTLRALYDNERGKGDHKHLGEHESLYKFVDIETLMADFLRDVEAMR